MFRSGGGHRADDEASLAARAAWLSYVGGYKQEEIAERLHLSRIKVNRLISLAHREGMIRVFVEGTVADCVGLEDALIKAYGLDFAIVANNLNGTELPLLTLGTAGARFLHSVLDDNEHEVIGLGQGRTLAAIVDNLPRARRSGVKFVSLLGGVSRDAAANPIDIIHRLAERTAAESYFMPVPFFLDNAAAKEVVLSQRSVQWVLELADRASLCLLGIGEIGDNAFLRLTGVITEAETRRLQEAGAVGEVLGKFLDRSGRELDVELNQRSVGHKLEELRGRMVVAVAGGQHKAAAIDAVLRTGVLKGLITDEATARNVVSRSQAS